MLELYKNIKKYRLSLGMSQEELAKMAGYTDRSSIAKIEKGQVDIPQSKIHQFAKIFNVTASELMGNDGIVVNIEPIRKAYDRLYEDAAPGLSMVIKMYELFNETDRAEVLALMNAKMAKYQKKRC